ncbi:MULTISPECIES: putative capsular polysaccharide synthesis family protein [Vibrio]|uniref:putative capsular polysaccharide synthesis family protein n=1 Tax=Vibrio TaxID=662 RepID=UPI0020C0B4F3|nr:MULTISPECIES: putative capsular polysaccharide synthesis family protein [Vibrio]MCK8062884.1 putative capsular polysaccharide synthesis family protein [Vibrio sp. 1CM7H]
MSRNTPTNSNASWYQTLKSQEQPVLIYQMGKVGSSALEHSIPNSIHLHDLMTVDAQKQISPVRAQLHKPQINALKRRLKRIAMSRMLKHKKKVRIISLVREPIGRNISMFFQALPFWMADKYLKDDSAIRTERPQLLQEAFDKHMNHQYPLQWFDNEIKQLTGIDVFNEPFNHEVGYQTYHNNNFSLLVIRSDKLAKANSAVEDFLGYPVDVVYENQSDNKWYSPLMKEFKTQFQPTPEYVEEMLNSKLAKHFFSNAEITDLKQQYLTN